MADDVKTDAEKNVEEAKQPSQAAEKPRRQGRAKVKEAEAPGAPAQEQRSQEAQKSAKRRRVQNIEAAAADERLLFGRYKLTDVTVSDQSLANYINLMPVSFPNIYGRRKNFSYYNTHISIVERLVNKLMRGGTGKKVGGKVIRTEGRLQGKKLKVMHIVEDAFEIINESAKMNPVQVLVNALQNAAPIEDTTRVRYGGISYNVAVDISSNRRLNLALRNIALAAIIGAFKNRRSIAEALANEIMLAANKDPNSYAVKKRVEAERIARSAR